MNTALRMRGPQFSWASGFTTKAAGSPLKPLTAPARSHQNTTSGSSAATSMTASCTGVFGIPSPRRQPSVSQYTGRNPIHASAFSLEA